MNIEKLEKILSDNNQPKFRLKQILQAVYQDGVSDFGEISVLPKELREKFGQELKILSFDVEKILVSKSKDSRKVLLKLQDGNFIETVLMNSGGDNFSVCVSSQVGCPMGCRFCATGKMGFRRNLTAEEIADQVLFWKQYLKSRNSQLETRKENISNVVFMGMGEPFLNWEAVSESLKILTDKNFFGMGSRSISVSTSGIAEGIEKMAREFPQVNLAISLHFADDQKRSEFMPVNKKDNLESLKQALKKYFSITNRQVFLEYIMLDKINDTPEDARQLASYVKSIEKLQLLHVNLIRYNSTVIAIRQQAEKQSLNPIHNKLDCHACLPVGRVVEAELPRNDNILKPSSRQNTEHFKKVLQESGISVTIRKSIGEEIQGACGQLAGG